MVLTFLHLTSQWASAGWVLVLVLVLVLGGSAPATGENEESDSISCLLSLPTVWEVLDRHVHMWYFPSYDRRAGRTDTPLARSNILFSGCKCKVITLHSRQLEKLGHAARYEEKCKATPLNIRVPTSNPGGIQRQKVCYVRSHEYDRKCYEWSTI